MRSKVTAVVFGIALVALGVVLSGNTLGWWSADVFFEGWWTLFLIVPAIASIIGNGPNAGNLILLAIGALLLADAQRLLGDVSVWSLLLPVVVIILGVSVLWKALVGPRLPTDAEGCPIHPGNRLNAIFTGTTAAYTGLPFNGAVTLAMFGGLDVDLRGALLSGAFLTLAIVIGDVCDKGVGAALFMTLFRSLIRATSLSGFLRREGDASGVDAADADEAAQVRKVLLDSVATTSRYIATTHSRSSMFASVFFGVLDPLSGDLVYVNGGHESPMIFGAGGRHEVLEVTGGVLGLFPFARFGIAATRLQPGDLLFSYTDGVNEAKNEKGEQFAEQRIRDAAAADWTWGS